MRHFLFLITFICIPTLISCGGQQESSPTNKAHTTVTQISSAAQFDTLLTKHNFVVADFYASWCKPCQRQAPIFEQIAQEYPTVQFVKIDIDRCAELATRYHIKSIPTIVYIKNGTPSKTVPSFSNAAAMRQQLIALTKV